MIWGILAILASFYGIHVLLVRLPLSQRWDGGVDN
jgi:phage shock protein PspC (stress-responsive transcriptional regulator)